MWNKFLRDPLHIVKDYELRKLLWQSGGGGHSGVQKIFEVQRYRS